MVRFDTYNASAHLVRQLESSGVATVTHDGGDNVLVELRSGYEISIHLIETRLPLYEIRLMLTESREADIHTLFIVWSSMFLPDDNELFVPEPWMLALVDLYGGKLYAFDVYGKDIRIFATYFEQASSTEFRVHYGEDINVTKLGVGQTKMKTPELAGTWLIADFAGIVPPTRKRPQAETRQQQPPKRHTAVKAETPWDILGVNRTAKRDDIKKAFRKLARRYHPDVNRSPDATHQMQRLNVAYQAALRELPDET